MSAHTPGPWTMRRRPIPNGPERSMDCAIMDATGEIIAETFEKVGRTSNGLFIERPATANAAFIVRACNSHEELLEALKGLVSIGWNDSPLVRVYAKEILEAEQAIVKAEGRGQP